MWDTSSLCVVLLTLWNAVPQNSDHICIYYLFYFPILESFNLIDQISRVFSAYLAKNFHCHETDRKPNNLILAMCYAILIFIEQTFFSASNT